MVSILYSETALFCAILILLIYNRTSAVSEFSKSGKNFIFLLTFSFLFCIIDTLWGFVASGKVNLGKGFYIFLSYAFHFSSSVTVYIWFLFCLRYFRKAKYQRLCYKIIPLILLCIELIIIISNLFNGRVFYITDDFIYETGDLRFWLFLCQFFNFIIMLILSIICTKKEKDGSRKKYLINAVYFSLVPLCTGIFQFLCPDAPVYSIGFTTSVFTIYAFVITYEHSNLLVQYQNKLIQSEFEEKLKRNYQIISSLAGRYDFVALINTEENTIKKIKISEIFQKHLKKDSEYITPEDFDNMLNSIIPESAIGDFKKRSDRDFILPIIKKDKRYVLDFIGQIDKSTIHYRMYFAFDEDNHKNVLIGIRNVESEFSMMAEIEEQKQKIINLQMQNELNALMASIDGLTGLLNKTAFSERVEHYVRVNTSQDCALIFFDMDHFKSVNDVFGHEKGDEVLKDMAKKLKSMYRSDELIGRMGGDEFCIFLPNIKYEIVEERIQNMNEKLKDVYKDDNATIKTTVSIGCVYCKINLLSYTEMTSVADKAMYEIKKSGRNSNLIKIV